MCELIIVIHDCVTVSIRVRGQVIYSEQFTFDENTYSVLKAFSTLLIYSSVEIHIMPDVQLSVPSNNVCVGVSGQFVEVINHDDYIVLSQLFPRAKFYNLLESLATLGSFRVRTTESILLVEDNGESANLTVSPGKVSPIDVDKVLCDEIELVPLEFKVMKSISDEMKTRKIVSTLSLILFYVGSISSIVYATSLYF